MIVYVEIVLDAPNVETAKEYIENALYHTGFRSPEEVDVEQVNISDYEILGEED